ncbi:MAG TPA: PP2C family serine/threonine-protein phosphatase [Rhodanobacteraceae bacterium]|nr:PP2C family serine/threonine-protein phosphatase [Rhodanobacteraceae bacterium]
MIEHGHATHTGLRREHNEDTYWADAERCLWLVADGMGGHARGEVASALALEAMLAAVGVGIGMADAFRRAGAAILANPGQRKAAAPMGSTLAALRLDGQGGYELAWVGDSRIYLWQDGTLVREARAPGTDGRVAEEAAPRIATRHRITQALGITPVLDLDVEPVTGRCESGTQFLLCSDGLGEELDDARIAALLSRTDLAAQECVDQLVLAALDAGGRDNITAVLVRTR